MPAKSLGTPMICSHNHQNCPGGGGLFVAICGKGIKYDANCSLFQVLLAGTECTMPDFHKV